VSRDAGTQIVKNLCRVIDNTFLFESTRLFFENRDGELLSVVSFVPIGIAGSNMDHRRRCEQFWLAR
jgi:hypothetical protein